MELRKGLALAILWADLPVDTRAEFEAWAAGEPIADCDRAAGVLSVGRYAAVSGGPTFVEVYELAREEAAASPACLALQEATLRALARAGAIAYAPGAGAAAAAARGGLHFASGVYAQIFPPALDERNAVHGPPPALQVGRIGIPPEHENEFNEWYNSEYLVGYLKVPGVYSARRYVNRSAGLRYLTVYELAHAEVSRQADWDRARAQSVWRRRIERLWTHAPGSPGIYRRLAAR